MGFQLLQTLEKLAGGAARDVGRGAAWVNNYGHAPAPIPAQPWARVAPTPQPASAYWTNHPLGNQVAGEVPYGAPNRNTGIQMTAAPIVAQTGHAQTVPLLNRLSALASFHDFIQRQPLRVAPPTRNSFNTLNQPPSDYMTQGYINPGYSPLQNSRSPIIQGPQ